MPTVSEMFPSPYVAAADLRGQPLLVTIDRVAQEVVDPANGEKAYICYFVGHKRGLRLNKINAKTIGKAHGPESLGWPGKQIEIYPTVCMMKGEEVDCIRVRAATQAALPEVAPVVMQPAAPVAAPQNGQGATQSAVLQPIASPVAPPVALPVPAAAPAPTATPSF